MFPTKQLYSPSPNASCLSHIIDGYCLSTFAKTQIPKKAASQPQYFCFSLIFFCQNCSILK